MEDLHMAPLQFLCEPRWLEKHSSCVYVTPRPPQVVHLRAHLCGPTWSRTTELKCTAPLACHPRSTRGPHLGKAPGLKSRPPTVRSPSLVLAILTLLVILSSK